MRVVYLGFDAIGVLIDFMLVILGVWFDFPVCDVWKSALHCVVGW